MASQSKKLILANLKAFLAKFSLPSPIAV